MMQVSSVVVSASLVIGEGVLIAQMLGQAGPTDFSSLLQFGLGSGLAAYLIMYELPKQRKEERDLMERVVDRYEKTQEAASLRFHAELMAQRESHEHQIQQLSQSIQCRGGPGGATPPRS